MVTDPERLYRTALQQFEQKSFESSEATLAALLNSVPAHARGHLLQASIDLRFRRYRKAHLHVMHAAGAMPADAESEYALFGKLGIFNEHAEMVASAERLLAWRLRDVAQLSQVISALSAIGAFALADRFAEQMQRRAPNLPATLMAQGYLAVHNGAFDLAENALSRAVAIQPRMGMASWLLSRLQTQTLQKNHVDQLRRVLADPASLRPVDSAFLGYALHKELHDLGDFAGAWAALAAACASKRQITPYDEASMMALFDAIEAMPIRPAMAEPEAAAAMPIFIVGMHRSGTTLLERMLGRHPQVVDCGETYRFTAQLREAADHHCKGVVDQRIIASAAGVDAAAIARGYLESCRWRLRDDCTHFTEKLPSNFLVIGLIKQALPQARILHMRRDPMDTCLSNLRELFSDACAYSYDQGELGRYYRRYERLMAHWHRCFPGEILDVRYEDLVAQPEAEARRVLDYCGLPWRDDVIDVTGHAGAVTTASAVQVRSPIHRRSVGAWRAYEVQLAPLRGILDA